MRPTRPIYFTILSLFLTLFTINMTVRAADDDDTDEYDVKRRALEGTINKRLVQAEAAKTLESLEASCPTKK